MSENTIPEFPTEETIRPYVSVHGLTRLQAIEIIAQKTITNTALRERALKRWKDQEHGRGNS